MEQLTELIKLLVLEAAFKTNLLKKMGYKYIGRNNRIGSDTLIHTKDDDSPAYHANLTKCINKNLNKGGYYRSKKHDTLKDPPSIGISWDKDEKN